MLPPDLPIFLLNALTYTCVYFLIAAGLSLIFGVLGILNCAHGALYMVGAYVAVTLIKLFTANPLLQFLSMIVAGLSIGLIGILIERFQLRFIYQRQDTYQLLLTYGWVLVFDDLVKLLWGLYPQAASEPYLLAGSSNIAGKPYPNYNFVMMAGSAIVALLLFAVLFRTWMGRVIRATSMNRELASGIGINVNRTYTYTFALGAMLVGFSGALVIPSTAASVGMGADILVEAFAIVAIGGLGSLKGAFIGSIIAGVLRSFGIAIFPEIETALLYLITAAVLLVRPWGLFGKRLT